MECTNYPKEKELQKFIEEHMKTFLGINFVDKEYRIEKGHRKRRIDSVGIDEDNRPVIIEYKCSYDEDIIGQVIRYRNLLKKDKYEFQSLVMKKLKAKYVYDIKWSETRVLCISSDFLPEIEEMAENESIELIRYKKYGNDTVLFEFVNSKDATKYAASTNDKNLKKPEKRSRSEFSYHLENMDESLKDLYYAVEDFIKKLGDDIQEKELKRYKAFKQIKGKDFVRILVRPQREYLLLYLNLDPEKFHLKGITHDIRNYHLGILRLGTKISSIDDFEKTKHLIIKSYEAS